MRQVNQERALAVLSPLVLLALWQFASYLGWIDQRYVPSPASIAQAGWELAVSGQLAGHIGATAVHDLARHLESLARNKELDALGPLLRELEAAFERARLRLEELKPA